MAQVVCARRIRLIGTQDEQFVPVLDVFFKGLALFWQRKCCARRASASRFGMCWSIDQSIGIAEQAQERGVLA
jgi:hypothetical protein